MLMSRNVVTPSNQALFKAEEEKRGNAQSKAEEKKSTRSAESILPEAVVTKMDFNMQAQRAESESLASNQQAMAHQLAALQKAVDAEERKFAILSKALSARPGAGGTQSGFFW